MPPRRTSSTAAAAGSCRASSIRTCTSASARRRPISDRVAIGGAGRRHVGAVVLPHGGLPRRVRRLPRSRPWRRAASTSACISASRVICTSTRWPNARRGSASRRTSSISCTRARRASRRASPRSTTRCCSRRARRRPRSTAPCSASTARTSRSSPICASRCAPAGRDDLRAWNEQSPDFLEAENVHRACYFAGKAGAAINIVHLSSKEALDEVRRHRRRASERRSTSRRVRTICSSTTRRPRACSPR